MKETTVSLRKMVLLALASATFLTPVVHGATVQADLNHLILGFRAAGAPGQSLNLEVDLGLVSAFYGAAAGSTIQLPGLSVQDMVATYGANWFTRTDLFWGAVATTGRFAASPDGLKPIATLWATRPDGQAPWNRSGSISQKNTSSNMEPMMGPGSFGTLQGAPSTSNSTSAAVIDATQDGSWSKQDLKLTGTSFGFFNPTVDSPATVPVGGQVMAQLYEMSPGSGPGTLLGNLVLTRTGLSFHAASTSAASIIGVSGDLAFGNVITGATATATLTITNAGTAAMTVTNITSPSGFTGVFSGTIAAGSATNVTVTFAPTAVTSYTGNVVVNSDATSGTGTIAASGAGIAAVVAPTKIVALSGSLAFGNVTTGATVTATLTVANSGTTNLTVSSISYPPGFSGAFSGTIPAGGSHNVTVTFAPTTVSSFSGNVTVNSDATSGTGTIAASGAGIAAVVASTKIVALSGSLAFGNVTTGATVTATLTIANSGTTNLTVSSISYPPGFSGAFSGTIPAGGSHNVTVTFAPTTVSSYSGNVTVNSDATSGTSTIAASGAGIAAPPVNHPPVITIAAAITNAELQVDNVFVVLADTPAGFTVGATDVDAGDSLTYQWQFGDGVTNAASPLATASHAYADCGSFVAGVAVNDGHANVLGTLTASVPCSNQVTALAAKLDFSKANNDTFSFTITGPAPESFATPGQKLTLDFGGAVLTFTNVTVKGKSLKASGPTGSVTGTLNSKTGGWSLKASLKKGSWQADLAEIGMVNQVVPKTPPTVLTVPVVVLLGNESVAGEAQVTYTATTKAGQAKKNK